MPQRDRGVGVDIDRVAVDGVDMYESARNGCDCEVAVEWCVVCGWEGEKERRRGGRGWELLSGGRSVLGV
jgi:hypothetical protein